MSAREELRDEVLAALLKPEHAPMSDHHPVTGECLSCPWPAHELPPEDLATLLADALLASPALTQVKAEAWDEGYLQADNHYETHHNGGHVPADPLAANPYRKEQP